MSYICCHKKFLKNESAMTRRISLREANHHLSRYVAAVERGEEIVITRRGEPVARLVPVDRDAPMSAAARAALDRTVARMREGYRLGSGTVEREELHDR